MLGGQCLIDQSPDGKGLWWVEMEEVFFHAGQTERKVDESKVQRYGMVIGLRSEMVESYKLLHKYTWPEILNKITEGNIRNYVIYLYKLNDKFYLFSYFEYIGYEFEADMALIDNDPATVAWTKFTDKNGLVILHETFPLGLRWALFLCVLFMSTVWGQHAWAVGARCPAGSYSCP